MMAGVSPVRAPRARRWFGRAVLAVALLVTVMTVALTVALYVDDATIEADPVRAVAAVLAVSPLRTGIEFVDAAGITVRPPGGVLYPGGLQVGQQFMVEYAAGDPDVVRVAGRSAATSLVMVVLTLLVTWVVAGPLLRWSRRPPRSVPRVRRVVG